MISTQPDMTPMHHSGSNLSYKEHRNHHEENNDNSGTNGDKPLAKLLVVDNDTDILQVLKLTLLNNRFLVDAFTNPEGALRSFKSKAERYCLVMSGIRMPAFSG